MDPRLIMLAGLGLSVVGALLAALMDAWSSRLLLTYFDAVESNLTKVVEALRTNNADFEITAVDPKRDNRLDRARGLKTVGWLLLVIGLAVQLASVYYARLLAR